MEDIISMICTKCDIVEQYHNFKQVFENGWEVKLDNNQKLINICPYCLEKEGNVRL